MEWVEVQGKTVDVAVAAALTELGLESRDHAQIEILQEAKPGFLGLGGQEAIVKVTRKPRRRRRRRRSRENDRPQSQTKSRGKQRSRREPPERKKMPAETKQPNRDQPVPPPEASIDEQAEIAKEFLSGLLEAFGLEGRVESRIEDDILYLDMAGDQTEALVGAKGAIMHAVLELTRTVVQRKTFGAPRMRLDINGYAERRREALNIYTGKLAAKVLAEGGEVMLEPMNSADRKVIHDAVADIGGVRSYSEGEEPNRAVVIATDPSATQSGEVPTESDREPPGGERPAHREEPGEG